ncbi:MAG TPA: aldehyde dehydrogenase family protein [Polyangiaceae bacterium]|jgi:acyl-CoA reductase-like NAD-dependent aldehyde dehydrogenase|nr:aldehyde dehydrogenase family protein [Polyangiaceae bacterium]
MRIENPASGALIAEVIDDTAASVHAAYEETRRAQPAWAATPLAERLAVGARFRELVAANKEELALTLTREMGKPVKQAQSELNALAGRIDFFLEHTAEVLAEETVLHQADGALDEVIGHEPLGVVANVSAWNYPWFVGSNVFVPALLTGNTVLYKPSEYTTLTGRRMQELWQRSGLPAGAFVTVVGGGAVGAAVVDEPVDGVFFTGSYATGRRIAERVAPRMIRLQLELGGKDPTYVTDDVDVRAAAESLADGAMYNTGQSCCSVERIYVHERVEAAFLEAFVDVVRGFRLGDPEDAETYIGPLARPAQLGVLDEQVADAVKQGARLLAGGHRMSRPGAYFAPTVLAGATNRMKVMREESFGPIIGIARVSGDDEAVTLMNDSEYGLTAGVYSRDLGRAERVLSRVNAGTVYINACDRVSPRLPWTGRRHSGIGSTLSTYGIRAFLQPKAWHKKR